MSVAPTDNELVDPTIDKCDNYTTGVGGHTQEKNVREGALGKLDAAILVVIKLTIPSMSGVASLNPLECVEKGRCLAKGGVISEPCELPYGSKKIKTRVIFK